MGVKANQAGISVFLSSDRLASLSDTMFGVAMTLVVTTLLPFTQAHRSLVLAMLPGATGELVAVVLSFAISARYWVSQQQRLAKTISVSALETWLHLAFLFLIVLVPISTSLSGLAGSGAELGPVMIYGVHLSLIALVNLLLWMGVHRTVDAYVQIVRSALALATFLAALAVGSMRPDLAVYLWFAVLATPMLAPLIARRWHKT